MLSCSDPSPDETVSSFFSASETSFTNSIMSASGLLSMLSLLAFDSVLSATHRDTSSFTLAEFSTTSVGGFCSSF